MDRIFRTFSIITGSKRIRNSDEVSIDPAAYQAFIRSTPSINAVTSYFKHCIAHGSRAEDKIIRMLFTSV